MKNSSIVLAALLSISVTSFAKQDLSLQDFKGRYKVTDCNLISDYTRAYISDLKNSDEIPGLKIFLAGSDAKQVELQYGETLGVKNSVSPQPNAVIDYDGEIDGLVFTSTACHSSDIIKTAVCDTTRLASSQDKKTLTLTLNVGTEQERSCVLVRN